MKLAREGGGDGPLISGFVRGGFRVDDNVYTALLITPHRADGWAPPAVDATLTAQQRGLFVGGAAAAEVDEAGFSSDRQKGSLLPKWLGTAVDEVASYAEDPHVTERWVFSQQKKMGD